MTRFACQQQSSGISAGDLPCMVALPLTEGGLFLPASATLDLFELTAGNATVRNSRLLVPAGWLPSLVCWQTEAVSCELSPGQAIGPHLSVSRKHHHRLNEGSAALGRLGVEAHGEGFVLTFQSSNPDAQTPMQGMRKGLQLPNTQPINSADDAVSRPSSHYPLPVVPRLLIYRPEPIFSQLA
jgi:hypothetical protein